MKRLLVFSVVVLSSLSYGQYTRSSGTQAYSSGLYQLFEFSTSGYYTMEVENIAWCKQTVGAVSEPCPWTPNWANLFDNLWTDTHSRFIDILQPGAVAKWAWYFEADIDTERWTKVADGSVFEREIYSKTFDDKPRVYTGP